MLVKFAEHLKPTRILDRVHKGVVVDNLDPLKLGRVKCTVSRLFEGEKEVLPWIYPMSVSPTNFGVPKLGEELLIKFPDKNIYSPYYDGYFHHAKNHNPYFDDDYPNTTGKILTGLKWKFNEKTQIGEMVHESGTKVDILKDGSLKLNIAKDLALTVTGKYEVTATGDVKIASDAKVEVSGKAGTDLGSADSTTTIKGAEVIIDAPLTNIKSDTVMLAGGGSPVAVLGCQSQGTGNQGAPVISMLIEGSSKVSAPK